MKILQIFWCQIASFSLLFQIVRMSYLFDSANFFSLANVNLGKLLPNFYLSIWRNLFYYLWSKLYFLILITNRQIKTTSKTLPALTQFRTMGLTKTSFRHNKRRISKLGTLKRKYKRALKFKMNYLKLFIFG